MSLDIAFDLRTKAPVVTVLPTGERIVSGEALVVLERRADLSRVHEEIVANGMRVVGSIPTLGIYRVELTATDVEGMYSAVDDVLTRVDGVQGTEWNGVITTGTIAVEPSDTWFTDQWHHTNWDSAYPSITAVPGAMATQDAWWFTQGSPAVQIAVLDTGIDFEHPELTGRLLPGYDFVDEDADPSTANSHGVLVTLVLAANADNAFGTAGVDDACMILPVRVIPSSGLGTYFDAIQGIEFAASSGADVINMSFVGGGGGSALERALKFARDEGAVLIAIAGNAGSGGIVDADAAKPGASPWTISVGAIDWAGSIVEYSLSGTAVDCVAPGFGVVTSWPLSDGQDKLWLASGTSIAAPLVSGVVGLMKSLHPHATHDQVYAALRAGAVDGLGDPRTDLPGWDKHFGHGRLNALQGLEALCQFSESDPLFACPRALSLLGGGKVSFKIKADDEYAGGRYLVLGSMSGWGDGALIGATLWPFVADAYTHLCLVQAKQAPWTGNFGTLDSSGQASVFLDVPPMLPDLLGGMQLDHAAAVWVEGAGRPMQVAATFVSDPRQLMLRLPPQVVFSEDFEGGLAGWSVQSEGPAAWHLAEDGECGAVSRMAAFNEAATCSFTPGTPTESRLQSPSFTFSKDSPFTLEFDMVRDFAGGSLSTIQVVIVDETATAALVTQKVANYQLTNDEWGTGLVHVRVQMPQSSKFEGRTVHLEFVGSSKVPAPATGWLVDNIVIRDLGALPNSSGP